MLRYLTLAFAAMVLLDAGVPVELDVALESGDQIEADSPELARYKANYISDPLPIGREEAAPGVRCGTPAVDTLSEEYAMAPPPLAHHDLSSVPGDFGR